MPSRGRGLDLNRDLMSPVISEQHYKSGMKKDENGFMDIEWCRSVVLNSWDELREVFMRANAKKAIAPTQVLTPSLFLAPPHEVVYIAIPFWSDSGDKNLP